MARHYYLTRAGRLRRKDNTLCFEPAAEAESGNGATKKSVIEELFSPATSRQESPAEVDAPVVTMFDEAASAASAQEMAADALLIDEMGDLALEPDADFDEAALAGQMTEAIADAPVRVAERRAIPIEDVDALWAFGELELNARVLNFLAQHRVPVHFFNYYGYYSGSFYPREYLNAGFVLVKQVRHYSNRRLRLAIAREFIHSALHNILRNLRYYGARGITLDAEIEGVQAEALRLDAVRDINELMGCEGRARSCYYRGFAKILRERAEFTKRVKRPPDNPVNALISFTNGLVYAATLTQIYRTQLNPTISFLHEPGARRFSLALDLAEIFKPILADRLLFKLINNRQIDERDFSQDLNGCYLKESGRKVVLKEWDARLETTIEHRRLHRKVSYERLIRLECYKLVKHLTQAEPYVAFRAWW
ncbi:MAG: type I-B CRISPR-associated endonuclease Cas1b [Blastocatellia bacterium]